MVGNGAEVLRLDTTAPVVTWGGAGGTSAGQNLIVGYSLNEPSAVAARLVLADRTLPATVFGDRVEVLLPPDAPAGLATVELDVLDDVGNAATRTHVVLLGGVAPPPTEPVSSLPRPSSRPARRRRQAPQRHEVRSAITTRSESSIVAHHATVGQIATRVSTYVLARAESPESAEVSRLVQRTLTTVRHRAYAPSQVGVRATADRRRRDDPALIALLLVD